MLPEQALQIIQIGSEINTWLKVLVWLVLLFISWTVAMFVWRGLIKSSIRSFIKIKF
jgi:hypothetical protein